MDYYELFMTVSSRQTHIVTYGLKEVGPLQKKVKIRKHAVAKSLLLFFFFLGLGAWRIDLANYNLR